VADVTHSAEMDDQQRSEPPRVALLLRGRTSSALRVSSLRISVERGASSVLAAGPSGDRRALWASPRETAKYPGGKSRGDERMRPYES